MTDGSPSERRRFTRVNFDTTASILQGGQRIPVHLIDVSLKGILIDTPEEYTLKADLPAQFEILLADETVIDMKVHLVHSSNKMLGFQCESIDIDSISHLRRLIELNMDIPNASERILEELISGT